MPTAVHTKPKSDKATPKPKPFLLPFQQRWVSDTARIKLWEKSRQLGASWTAAFEDARECSRAGALHDVWISSRDQTQSQLYIADVRKWATILDVVARRLGSRILADVPHESGLQVVFANGRKATALGSAPDAQAGKRGHRRLDEFALNRDPKRLYGIAYPGITWGGQISIISTHRGSGNYFNELITEAREKGNPKRISVHTTTLSQALEEGFLERLQSKLSEDDPRKRMSVAEYYDYTRAGCPDEETFLEEFECRPADDNAAFLEYPLITACEYDEAEVWESTWDELISRNNPLFLGLDIGRTRDLSSFWLVEEMAGVKFTRRLDVMKNAPYDQQEAKLDMFMRLPNLRRACIDSNGIGNQLSERAKKRFGNRVEQVLFTNASKSEMAYPVRALFEKRAIWIPPSRDVRADLHSVRKIYTESANVRFAGDRGENGHADRFWSLALAVHGGERPSGFFATVI